MIDFLQELQTYADKYDPHTKGNDVWIKCPFHGGGQERTPSCRINLTKGKYPVGFWYCYGCGKHGSWNDLAQAIPGLTLMNSQEIKDQDLVMTKLSPAQIASLYGNEINEQVDFNMMVDWDKNTPWRGISGDLLYKLGSKLSCNKRTKDLQLFLPCYQNNELRGGINCRLQKVQGLVSYMNTAGPWVKKTLFPYDYVKKIYRKTNVIALVEGPRDALNLIDNGFPALAILGSQNWSSMKENLVRVLDPKILVLAFDADEAGEHAYETVRESFKDLTNICKLQFKDGQDPGDLTRTEIRKYLRKVCSL